MNRRSFLKAASGACLASGLGLPAAASPDDVGLPSVRREDPKLRNRRPYAGVDWTKARQVNTTSHGHCVYDRMLEPYKRRNFGLYTISNYYPSAPTMPGKTFDRHHYRLHHDWPMMVNGKRKAGPFDWNAIIEPWKDELPEELRRQLPFRDGGVMLPSFPDGVLEAPNAEHHCFLDGEGRIMWPLHVCAPGSAFKSGSFDSGLRFLTKKAGFGMGMQEFWKTGFDRLIDALVVPDGGGLTINHPSWSHHRREDILTWLDHDARVLGIEVLENGYNSEHYWDWVLSTGRQCFGFFVPDWRAGKLTGDSGVKDGPDVPFGVNVLVVPEYTVEACLRAYRRGDFYGARSGLGALKFTSIEFGESLVVATTDRPARFELVTARGVVHRAEGTRIEWSVPKPDGGCSREGSTMDMFARIRAHATDGSGEVLFSQPYMLPTKDWTKWSL